MKKKCIRFLPLLLACLLLVCLVLPVSAADAPALYGTANAADGTVTVTLSLRGGSAVRRRKRVSERFSALRFFCF